MFEHFETHAGLYTHIVCNMENILYLIWLNDVIWLNGLELKFLLELIKAGLATLSHVVCLTKKILNEMWVSVSDWGSVSWLYCTHLCYKTGRNHQNLTLACLSSALISLPPSSLLGSSGHRQVVPPQPSVEGPTRLGQESEIPSNSAI